MDTRSPCYHRSRLHGLTEPGPEAGEGTPGGQPGKPICSQCLNICNQIFQQAYLLPDHLVQLCASGGGGAGDHQRNSKQTWAGKEKKINTGKFKQKQVMYHLYFSLDRK